MTRLLSENESTITCYPLKTPKDLYERGIKMLSDNYQICCFVELILLQEVPARKAKHSLSLDGRGLG
jgi:hypothetical protein